MCAMETPLFALPKEPPALRITHDRHIAGGFTWDHEGRVSFWEILTEIPFLTGKQR